MKTTPFETIVISFALFVILGISFFIVFLVAPFTRLLFRDYHVVSDVFLLLMLFMMFSALIVRISLKISPLRSESFSMLSKRAAYWKFITSVTEMGGMYFLFLVPVFLRPLFFSLFGAKIGQNVEIAGKLIELPLITIEEYAFIGGGVFITAHAIVHDRIVLEPVKISKKVTVGIGAIILPGVEIGENSIVAPGAVVSFNTKVPPSEFWGGIPAKKIKDIIS
jgi:hypothetical protein